MEQQKLDELASRVKEQVLRELDLAREPEDQAVETLICQIVRRETASRYLTLAERGQVKRRVFNAIRRLDILQEIMEDEAVTEIMIIGKEIFVEREGRILQLDRQFDTPDTVENIVQRIAAGNNRQVNTRTPIADARLDDGSRVHIVLPPAALNGPVVTIRRFPKEPLDMRALIRSGSLTQEAADFLQALVRAGYNLFVSGGTGSGKTTFLNALAEFIPPSERIVVIEDTAELQIRGIPNLVRLEAREKNLEGENEITIRQLVRASLRMRPDRIIIGEVRGEEAVDLLQAMNTGHDGSISTGHGNSPADMLNRLETMAMMGMDIPAEAVRRQIASALDILVHLGRLRDGSRRVLEIAEITGIGRGVVQTRTLYAFEEICEDEHGHIEGRLMRQNSLENEGKLRRAGIRP